MAKNPFPPAAPPEDHDFSDDELRPKDVQDHIRAHDERMRVQARGWALAKAMYCTSYWQYLRGDTTSGSGESTDSYFHNWLDVEVNRLFPIVGSYLAALYPRAQRAIVARDPAGKGDPEKTQIALNRWLSSKRIHQRVMSAIRQGIIYPGAGAKVGYDPGYGNPLDRVWFRIIPWWELVLDFDVGDAEDQRFRGHIYYQSKKKIEREYNLEGKLKGTRRDDFLDRQYHGGQQRQPDAVTATSGTHAKATSDQEAFVRVIELCNLVDEIEDEHGNLYRGRLEIYILGQDGNISDKPVYMGPLPFAKHDGTPAPHILELVFNHEPEFPLRGIPHSARVLPQIQELNSYRAFMAMSTRKDTRQYLTRKGTFTGDELTKLTQGVDGLVLEVDKDFERPITDAIIPIQQGVMSTNIDRYLNYVELDLERSVAQSPQARGEVTKATAFEVQTVQQYTESEFGMHAAIKDDWLGSVLHVALFALKGAMQDVGHYAGAYDGQEEDLQLASVGATTDGKERPEAEDEKAVAIAEVEAGQEPHVGTDAVPPSGQYEISKKETAVVQKALTLQNDRGEPVVVEVADLDAAFEISFVEGGRTPLTDAAMQQNLVVLLQPYSQLWQTVQQGGAMATFAKSYMQVIAERFDLPKDLHPSELESKAAEEPPPSAQPEVPTNGGPPQQLLEMVERIRQLPPDDALGTLARLFEGQPQMLQMLQQIAQMPPDQQAAMIDDLLNGLLQGQQQGPPPAAPPQEGPPPGPEGMI